MWAGGGGHTELSLNAPLGVPNRCATPRQCLTLPKCLRIFANRVGDTTTTANSGIHSLSGSASTPGTSTHNSCTSSDEQCYRHTSTGVRRPQTAHSSSSVNSAGSPRVVAARPVLTIPLSLGPRDGFPADASVEDSIKRHPTVGVPLCGTEVSDQLSSLSEKLPVRKIK